MSQDIQKDDEIDLLALLQKIVQGKKTIFKCFLVFFVIGVFIALTLSLLSFIPVLLRAFLSFGK